MLCLKIKPKIPVMIADTCAILRYRLAEWYSIVVTTWSRKKKLKNPGKLSHIDSTSLLSSFELLDGENGSSIFLRNFDDYLPVDMA